MPDEEIRRHQHEQREQHKRAAAEAAEAAEAEAKAIALAMASTAATTTSAADFTPFYDRILVRRTDDPAASNSNFGFAVPDAAKEKPMHAVVVAVGFGRMVDDQSWLQPLRVRVGDHILVGKYTGTDVKLAGVEYAVLREDEVLGVIGKRVGQPVVDNPNNPNMTITKHDEQVRRDDTRPDFMT
jgi:chaperonin GroES